MEELIKRVNDRLITLHQEREALEESEQQLKQALESVEMRKHQVQGAIEELRMLMTDHPSSDQEHQSQPSSHQY